MMRRAERGCQTRGQGDDTSARQGSRVPEIPPVVPGPYSDEHRNTSRSYGLGLGLGLGERNDSSGQRVACQATSGGPLGE